VPWPPQGLYAKKEVNSVADMQGVKFRAYNAATSRLAELMGAVPTKIEAAELSQAFATGAVDSMISSGSTGYDRKLWEHTKYWYNIQAWLPKNMVIVNTEAFNGLDEATRNVVMEKAKAAEDRGWAKAEELANWYVEELGKNGMTVGPAGDTLKADFQKIGETMTSEWLAKAGDTGKAAVDAYKEANEDWLERLAAIEARRGEADGGEDEERLGTYLEQTRAVFDRSLELQMELYEGVRTLRGEDAPEMDAPEMDAPEVDAAEVDAAEMDAAEVDAAEVDAAEVDAPEVALLEE
jgi:hypothetical protein